MSNIGSISVDILADTSGLMNAINSMNRRLSSSVSDVQRQTSNISNSFSRMGNAISASIASFVAYKGFNLITSGLSDAIDAYAKFESANIGLQSTIEAQGRSFSQAKGFIDSYISDGLVPLNEAVTAYKNLASRGYSTDQIEQTLLRLKDSASFGRQASLSLGKAVRTASEGLKNENSILVDNAGVTRNVSKMWDDYAASIGVGVKSLTQQQKIQAEVNGIMQETRFQIGDAERYSGTLAGGMSRLSGQFELLKVAVGSAFAPALQAVMPYVSMAIVKFTELMNIVASFSRALFGASGTQKTTTKTTNDLAGAQKSVASGAGGVADGAKKIAKEAKKAGKALNNNTQGFDELNVAQQEAANSADDVAKAMGGGGEAGTGATTTTTTESTPTLIPDIDTSKFTKALETMFSPLKKIDITPITDALKPLLEIDWNPLIQSIGSLTKGFTDLFNSFAENVIAPFLEYVIVPLAEKLAENVIPSALNAIGEAMSFLSKVLEPLNPSFEIFFKILGSIAGLGLDAIAGTFNIIGSSLKELNKFVEENPRLFNIMIKTLETVAIIVGIVGGVVMLFANHLAVIEVIAGIVAGVMTVVGAVIGFLTAPITLTILALTALVAVIWTLIEYWPELSAGAKLAWKWIVETFNKASEWFNTNVIKPIVKFFTELWESTKKLAESGYKSISDAILPIVTWIDTNIIKPISKLFSEVWDVISGIFKTSLEIIEAIILTIVAWIDLNITQPIKKYFETLWADIKIVWEGILQSIKDVILPIVEWFKTNITTPLKTKFDGWWTDIKQLFNDILAGIKEIMLPIVEWFDTNIIIPLQNKWTSIKEFFKTLWGDIGKVMKTVFITVINVLIGLLEGFLNTFVSGINKIVKMVNALSFKVPDWVPDIGGKEFGFKVNEVSNVKLGRLAVPEMATGGIVSSATLAMIGEGNSSEAVIPLNEQGLEPLINGIVNAMSQVMGVNNQQGKQMPDVILNIDGKEFARATYKYSESERNRRSNNFVLVT